MSSKYQGLGLDLQFFRLWGLGIIFWLLAQREREQSSSSRRHLEAAGDEHGAGPLFLDGDEANNVQVMVTALMSFG